MALPRQLPDLGISQYPATSGQRARWTLGEMVGRNPAMERLFLQMRYLANHLRVALLEGEPGTGKRLVAETLHQLSTHHLGSLAVCEASRFVTGGAATPLRQADGGLLYLTHADRLDPAQQQRLSQLLAGHSQARPGSGLHRLGTQAAPAWLTGHPNPRSVLVSSCRPLRPLVLQGRFRGDLYQQLSPVQLLLPALRDRREDIAMLAEKLLRGASGKAGRPAPRLTPESLALLAAQRWEGNVEQLRAVLFQAVALAPGEWIKPGMLAVQGGLGTETGAMGTPAGYHPSLVIDETDQTAQTAQAMPGLAAGDEPEIGPEPGPEPGPGIGSETGSSFGLNLAGPPSLAPALPSRSVNLGHPGSGTRAWPVSGGAPERSLPAGAGAARQGTVSLSGGSSLHPPAGRSGAPGSGGKPYPEQPAPDWNLDRAILRHVRHVLACVHGNKLQAARLLGISRSTLYRLLEGSVEASSVEAEPSAAMPAHLAATAGPVRYQASSHASNS